MSERRARRSLTVELRMARMTDGQVNAQRTGVNQGHRLTMALFGVFFFALFCGPGGKAVVYAQGRQPSPAAEPAKGGGDVARGKYLVEGVAMCGECHTPRNSSGGLDRSRWLQGSPMQWGPSGGGSNWPLIAPRIGGNPPATDADMIKLLTTGVWTTGKPLRLPMMPFRMSAADAKAVVAYLRSLTPQN